MNPQSATTDCAACGSLPRTLSDIQDQLARLHAAIASDSTRPAQPSEFAGRAAVIRQDGGHAVPSPAHLAPIDIADRQSRIARFRIQRWAREHIFVPMLAALTFFLLVDPLAAGHPREMIALNLLITLVLVAVVVVLDRGWRGRGAVALGFVTIALSATNKFSPDPMWKMGALVCWTSLFSLAIAVSLRTIVTARRVTMPLIQGAIAVYLLVGLLFSGLDMLIETVQPGSFRFTTSGDLQVFDWSDLLFYSFTTLTTLGYGDIVPVAVFARSSAILEASVGVMYVSVLISRVVSLQAAEAAALASNSEAKPARTPMLKSE